MQNHKHLCKLKLVISDWDETATLKDTIQFVARAASQLPLKRQHSSPASGKKPFKYYSEVYSQAYQKYINSVECEANNCNFEKLGDTTSVAEKIKQEYRFQRGLKNVELCSIRALEEDRYFQGLKASDFIEQAPNVQLRPGFIEFIRRCHIYKIPVIILSVNWTSHLIRAVLNANGVYESDFLKIEVNELKLDSNGITTGEMDSKYQTGVDKLAAVRQNDPSHTLYIGDSRTDILSMLECAIAVIMGNGSAISAASNLGLEVKKLPEASMDQLIYSKTNKQLFNTDNWYSIISLLETLHCDK